jgi:hypothetical protein
MAAQTRMPPDDHLEECARGVLGRDFWSVFEVSVRQNFNHPVTGT